MREKLVRNQYQFNEEKLRVKEMDRIEDRVTISVKVPSKAAVKTGTGIGLNHLLAAAGVLLLFIACLSYWVYSNFKGVLAP